MKNNTLGLLILFFTISLSANAQVKIGLVYSGQMTSTSGFIPFKKNIVNQVNMPTLTSGGGLLVTYDSHVKPRGVQLGILYSSHNQAFIYNYKIADESFTDPNKKLFDYIKFNLLLRKSGYIHKFVKSTFFIGPQFSYLLQYKGGIVVYDENAYYDLPPTAPNIYYKKYSIDAVIGYELSYAIHKRFDIFGGLRLDYGLNNIEQPGVTYNGVKVFTGSGSHQMCLALQFGAYYVFHRKDHLLLPSNAWRYRTYKKKGIKFKLF